MKIKLNEKYFPDEEFRAYLKDTFLWEEGQNLTVDERNKVTKICILDEFIFGDLYKASSIKSLKGIEHFPNLEWLNASDTKISELDVSKNKKLKLLSADNTNLTSLDVSHNPELRRLYVENTNIRNIYVRQNPELEHLNIDNTNITSLDVSHNEELTKLYVSNTNLTELNVNNCTKLEKLYAYDTNLTSLDVSKNTKVMGLSIVKLLKLKKRLKGERK